MANFKKFFNSVESTERLLSRKDSTENIANNILSAMPAFGFTADKEKQKFSMEVSKLVHSDEFIEALSNDIGQPKDDESEDEFVERAKKTMKTLLLKHLSKKGG